jgi:hypothetical protein
MDYTFTAQVEDWLDDVSRGERDWVKALTEFYTPFALALQSAAIKMQPFKGIPANRTADTSKPSADSKPRARRTSSRKAKAKPMIDPDASVCPKCGAPMVKRTGPRGEFWGCSTYPKCKGTRPV